MSRWVIGLAITNQRFVFHCNFVVLYVRRTLLKTSLYVADVTFLSKTESESEYRYLDWVQQEQYKESQADRERGWGERVNMISWNILRLVSTVHPEIQGPTVHLSLRMPLLCQCTLLHCQSCTRLSLHISSDPVRAWTERHCPQPTDAEKYFSWCYNIFELLPMALIPLGFTTDKSAYEQVAQVQSCNSTVEARSPVKIIEPYWK